VQDTIACFQNSYMLKYVVAQQSFFLFIIKKMDYFIRMIYTIRYE